MSLEHSWSVPRCPGEFLEDLWSILRALDRSRVLLEDHNVPGVFQEHPAVSLEYQQSTHIPGVPLEHATTSWSL